MAFKQCLRLMFVLIVAASYINGKTSVSQYTRSQQPWGIITSENWPKHYPNNINEDYNITVDSSYGVSLYFTNFDLEGNTGCTYDWVEIEDANGEQLGHEAKYCGNQAPPLVHTNTMMIVKFHADHSNVGTGFRAVWYEIFDSGNITSPNWPNHYPTNLDETYIIIVDTGYGVLLNFTNFDLEGGSGCPHDWVELEDANGRHLGNKLKYCGDQAPPPVHTNTNRIIVKFHTDHSVAKTGFRAVWYEVYGSPDQEGWEIKDSTTTTATTTGDLSEN